MTHGYFIYPIEDTKIVLVARRDKIRVRLVTLEPKTLATRGEKTFKELNIA